MNKILEIENLNKVYKNERGIFDLNLDIDKGDIFGFLGPNGAGKTTTMKIMTGLMKQDSGNVKIFGYNIREDFERALENVGCIIETVEAFSYMTAYDNLKYVSRYYNNIDKNRIDDVLELVGLHKYKKEKVKGFSLGMKQRLGIATAIINKPKLAILDEPLNGLDVEGMLEVRKLIKNLSEKENTTFFISSHLIHDVELTCNRVGIIIGGKLLNVDYIDNILMSYESLEKYFVREVEKNENIQNGIIK